MRCPECGAAVQPNAPFCPHCGANLPAPPPDVSPAPPAAESGQRFGCGSWAKFGVIGVLILVVTVGMFIAAVLAGFNQGKEDWQQNAQATAEAYYARCQRHLAAQEWELAAAACRETMRLADYPELAEQGRQGWLTAQEALKPKPTPTIAIVVEAAEDIFAEAQTRFEQEDWSGTLELLNRLWGMDPGFEAEAVADMRHTCFLALSRQMLAEDNLEMALYYMDQAAVFGPLPADLEEERQLAARYMSALNLLGVNWELAIERFTELYNTHPNYRDVFERLVQAHVDWAEASAARQDWCPAETQYTEALRLRADSQIEAKRAEAAQLCLTATPTPLPGTISGTLPPPQLQPIEGFNLGRLAYTTHNPDSGTYDLYARYADGRLIQVSAGASQPAWRRDGSLLAYRNGVGIQAVSPEEGVPLTLVDNPSAAWPTWSPDGARLAYALPEADGWQVYVVPADGSAPPQALAQGWAPLWGPTGALVFSGCQVEGVVKGICAVDPNDPNGIPVPLTADQRDTPMGWSPDGSWILYASPFDGDWDVYRVHVSGAVAQITTDPAADGAPVWSPDGSVIAFVSDRGGSWGIYLVSPEGGEARKIIDLGGSYPELGGQRLSWGP